MRGIGVFVCHCGSNIAATVDVHKVVEMAKLEPGVVHAEEYQYMCSEAGQEKIAQAIKEKNLSGIVVCSCSPRMHEATFRKCAEKAGLNPIWLKLQTFVSSAHGFTRISQRVPKRQLFL